jgi:hypothetical protein
MDEELDSQSWEIRETFAYNGRAVYASSVVEVALAHVLLYAQFMKKVRDDYLTTKGKGFDRKQYERDFDAFMDDQFAQTMGNLMRRVENFGGFDDALKDCRRKETARFPDAPLLARAKRGLCHVDGARANAGGAEWRRRDV